MALGSGITHRDVGNADIAGANICPCRNDEPGKFVGIPQSLPRFFRAFRAFRGQRFFYHLRAQYQYKQLQLLILPVLQVLTSAIGYSHINEDVYFGTSLYTYFYLYILFLLSFNITKLSYCSILLLDKAIIFNNLITTTYVTHHKKNK